MLDAGADRVSGIARADLLGGEMHRLLARAAHAIQTHGRHLDRKAGQQHRQPTDVGPLLAGLRHATGDDVLDLRRRKPTRSVSPLRRMRQQSVGANVAIGAPLAAKRSAHGFDNDRLRHDDSPWQDSSAGIRTMRAHRRPTGTPNAHATVSFSPY